MDDERFSKKLAADVAFHLDEAGVPNLLFGWLALSLVGSREILTEIDFVIPDAQIPTATATLVALGYPLCAHPRCAELTFDRVGDRCRHMGLITSDNRYHPVAAAHFHLKSGQYLLSLHAQSSLLWWLPELQPGPPAADDPDLTLSNDSKLPPYAENGGTGPWPGDLHPVKILNPNSFTEAVIMLYCRDSARDLRLYSVWIRIMSSLMDADGILGQRVEKHLRPKFQLAWDCFNQRIPIAPLESYYKEMKLLRNRLARAGELGPLIDANTWQPPAFE
ncbi:hypothetical protein BJX61DRAFT_541664 [Aspergillus egyptiacus]|nr:hypothetical protein BJX61DRAFT_541664 [Aspergillus egyptiacus]